MITKKTENSSLPTENFSFGSPTTVAEKIAIEKRRRHQTYMALDYFLSAVTYFDFFSYDAFKIVTQAKYIAQIYNKNVTSELLLLPFFNCLGELLNILEDFGLNQAETIEIISKSPNNKKDLAFVVRANMFKQFIFDPLKTFLTDRYQQIKGLFIQDTLNLKSNIKYSHEVNQLFEKAATNALNRFKTPVITPEILLITIMEEETTKASKILRKCLKTSTQWYLLRYRLIKLIHRQEGTLRSEVLKNQQYFAYLMKTQLSDVEFTRMIETEMLPKGVSFFRNNLVAKVLQTNIFDQLSAEIQTSIKISGRRSYSD